MVSTAGHLSRQTWTISTLIYSSQRCLEVFHYMPHSIMHMHKELTCFRTYPREGRQQLRNQRPFQLPPQHKAHLEVSSPNLQACRTGELCRSKSPNLTHLLRKQLTMPRYIKEKTTALKRASFLVLHAFCIRLQNEDYGFISAFIERHLSLRCVQKVPYHWQQMSSPQMDAVR